MEFSLLNERGIEVYNSKKAFLERYGLWEDIYAIMLESYAFNVQESERLAREINKEGLTTQYTNKGHHVNTIVNPKLKIYHQFCDLTFKVAAQFGFTPLSRKKLKIPDKKKRPDFMDDLD
jgi:phage terminase small subunit